MENAKSLFHRYEGMSGLEIVKENVDEETFKDYIIDVEDSDCDVDYENCEFMYDLMDAVKTSILSKCDEADYYSYHDVDSEMDLDTLIYGKVMQDMNKIISYYNVSTEVWEV